MTPTEAIQKAIETLRLYADDGKWDQRGPAGPDVIFYGADTDQDGWEPATEAIAGLEGACPGIIQAFADGKAVAYLAVDELGFYAPQIVIRENLGAK